jgi:hypothetical protein
VPPRSWRSHRPPDSIAPARDRGRPAPQASAGFNATASSKRAIAWSKSRFASAMYPSPAAADALLGARFRTSLNARSAPARSPACSAFQASRSAAISVAEAEASGAGKMKSG